MTKSHLNSLCDKVSPEGVLVTDCHWWELDTGQIVNLHVDVLVELEVIVHTEIHVVEEEAES